MKTAFYLFIPVILTIFNKKNTTENYPKAKVNYSDFENLMVEVKSHREERLLSFDEFLSKSKLDDVIILDTRSKAMYDNKHIKGAVHLNFSDFTQDNLRKIIPNTNTTILIYCNNNIEGDMIMFPTKAVLPKTLDKKVKSITLALNIPTYINLYGYGYKNVYELSELILPFDKRIEYEGSVIN